MQNTFCNELPNCYVGKNDVLLGLKDCVFTMSKTTPKYHHNVVPKLYPFGFSNQIKSMNATADKHYSRTVGGLRSGGDKGRMYG